MVRLPRVVEVRGFTFSLVLCSLASARCVPRLPPAVLSFFAACSTLRGVFVCTFSLFHFFQASVCGCANAGHRRAERCCAGADARRRSGRRRPDGLRCAAEQDDCLGDYYLDHSSARAAAGPVSGAPFGSGDGQHARSTRHIIFVRLLLRIPPPRPLTDRSLERQHRAAEHLIHAAVSSRGAILLWNPPQSPDLNPIEKVQSV
jgi:hypothetical protein